MKKVVVVDYGLGNLKSVQRGLEKVGANVELSSDPKVASKADRIVLPGVGAFENGMQGLRNSGIVQALNEFIQSGNPILGLCLGMQLLVNTSEEFGNHCGLGYIQGKVMKILQNDGKYLRKIPHIGWSSLHKSTEQQNPWEKTILRNTKSNEFFYFVHSYMVATKKASEVLAESEYEGLLIPAAIMRDNITGLQFHPEKSGGSGLKILSAFVHGK